MIDARSCKGVLTGYEPNVYEVWDVNHEKFTTVQDVINYRITRSKPGQVHKTDESDEDNSQI